jgi:hypothetical protein
MLCVPSSTAAAAAAAAAAEQQPVGLLSSFSFSSVNPHADILKLKCSEAFARIIQQRQQRKKKKKKKKKKKMMMKKTKTSATKRGSFRRHKRRRRRRKFKLTLKDQEWSWEMVSLTCREALNLAFVQLLDNHPAMEHMSQDALEKIRDFLLEKV